MKKDTSYAKCILEAEKNNIRRYISDLEDLRSTFIDETNELANALTKSSDKINEALYELEGVTKNGKLHVGSTPKGKTSFIDCKPKVDFKKLLKLPCFIISYQQYNEMIRWAKQYGDGYNIVSNSNKYENKISGAERMGAFMRKELYATAKIEANTNAYELIEFHDYMMSLSNDEILYLEKEMDK